MALSPLSIPQAFTVPAGAQGIQLPAAGCSLINFNAVTVYLVPTQDLIGNVGAAAPLVQGAAIPWPNSNCYGFVTGNTPGNVYISPVNSSVYPVPQVVTIGGQPINVDVANNLTLAPSTPEVTPPGSGFGTRWNTYTALPYGQAAINIVNPVRAIAITHMCLANQGQFNGVVMEVYGLSSNSVYLRMLVGNVIGVVDKITLTQPNGAEFPNLDNTLGCYFTEIGATLTQWEGAYSIMVS